MTDLDHNDGIGTCPTRENSSRLRHGVFANVLAGDPVLVRWTALHPLASSEWKPLSLIHI